MSDEIHPYDPQVMYQRLQRAQVVIAALLCWNAPQPDRYGDYTDANDTRRKANDFIKELAPYAKNQKKDEAQS